MNTKIFKQGTKVTGKYCGAAYSGIVTECRAHTIHPTRVEHTIKLDSEISVLGGVRDTVIIATCDANESADFGTIAAA